MHLAGDRGASLERAVNLRVRVVPLCVSYHYVVSHVVAACRAALPRPWGRLGLDTCVLSAEVAIGALPIRQRGSKSPFRSGVDTLGDDSAARQRTRPDDDGVFPQVGAGFADIIGPLKLPGGSRGRRFESGQPDFYELPARLAFSFASVNGTSITTCSTAVCYVSHGCTPGQSMSCSEASLFFTMITIPRSWVQVTGTRK